MNKPLLLLALALTISMAGCRGPFVVIPGGELQGPTVAAPSDWSFIKDIDTIQLETRPSDPYSVNIWVIGLGDSLYVHSGDNRATWIESMEEDPSVRLRANESVYELRAARVTSQDEFKRFSEVYEEKYGNPPRNGSVAEAYLFRLKAR